MSFLAFVVLSQVWHLLYFHPFEMWVIILELYQFIWFGDRLLGFWSWLLWWWTCVGSVWLFGISWPLFIGSLAFAIVTPSLASLVFWQCCIYNIICNLGHAMLILNILPVRIPKPLIACMEKDILTRMTWIWPLITPIPAHDSLFQNEKQNFVVTFITQSMSTRNWSPGRQSVHMDH